jgi:ribose transport system substrate-binding protein
MNYRPLCLLALSALALGGCVRETATGNAPAVAPANVPAAASKGADERLKVAVIPKGTTHEFWQTIKAGAEAAGKEVNAEILWNGPKAETDIQDQIDIIMNYASQGVDGVALAATDKSALVKTVEDLQGRGIPVVTIDSGIDPDPSRAFIATDNVAAARLAAQEMGKLLNGKGKVAVLSFLKGAGTSDEREQGFLEGIKEFPGITVAGVVETKSDSSKARDQMESLLSQHADLAGVFASNEPNVVGAAGVLKERKLTGKIKLVGFDASKAEIEYLKDGTVQAVVVQDPFKMGYEGVKAIAQIARGQGTPEKRIDTGATVVTKANMTEPNIHKLLYPLEGQQATK